MSFRREATTVPEQIADLYEKLRNLAPAVAIATTTSGGGDCDCPPGDTGPAGPTGATGATGATGPAGPAATVTIEDEGVSLGTFDSVDFVGAAVTATLVGTAATVTIASTAASVLDDPRWRMMVAV